MADGRNLLPPFRTTFRVSSEYLCIPETRADVSVNDSRIECSLALLGRLSLKLLALYHSASNICVEQDAAGEMVTLLSTGQVEVNAGNLERLVYMAHRYDMPFLHSFCERLYLSHLSPVRCLQFWLLAMNNGLHILQVEALKLIREHFEDISQTESFRHIGKSHVEMLILDPLVHVTSIETVYNAIQHWSHYSSEEDLRAPAKEQLMSAYFEKMCNTEPFDRRYHYLLNNETAYQESLSNSHTVRSAGHCNGHQRKQDNRRLSESHNTPDNLWIAKTKSNELHVVEMLLENGTLLPDWHNVSFPTKMENDSAFWYCAKRRCMYASNETDIWRLDEGRQNWRKCSSSPAGRRHHMMSGAGTKLYALGGYDNNSLRLTDYVLEYDTKKDSWTTFHHAGKVQERVQSGKCVAIDNDIYTFGGFHPDHEGNLVSRLTAQKYSTITKTSNRIADLPFDASKNCAVACAVTDCKYVYIFSSNGEFVRYSPYSDNHQCLPPYPTPRKQFGAFIADEILYIFGGQNRSGPVHDIHCLDLTEKNSDWQHCGMLNTPMLILSN